MDVLISASNLVSAFRFPGLVAAVGCFTVLSGNGRLKSGFSSPRSPKTAFAAINLHGNGLQCVAKYGALADLRHQKKYALLRMAAEEIRNGWVVCWTSRKTEGIENKNFKVPPRFEIGLLDSESNVLTTRPWDLFVTNFVYLIQNAGTISGTGSYDPAEFKRHVRQWESVEELKLKEYDPKTISIDTDGFSLENQIGRFGSLQVKTDCSISSKIRPGRFQC